MAWLVPNMWIAAGAYIISRIGTGLFLFNLYNYTAVAYPTRIRSKAFAWTDGLGHLGAWAGVTLLGPLYAFGPNHLGWMLLMIIPGALLPACPDPLSASGKPRGAGTGIDVTERQRAGKPIVRPSKKTYNLFRLCEAFGRDTFAYRAATALLGSI